MNVSSIVLGDLVPCTSLCVAAVPSLSGGLQWWKGFQVRSRAPVELMVESPKKSTIQRSRLAEYNSNMSC